LLNRDLEDKNFGHVSWKKAPAEFDILSDFDMKGIFSYESLRRIW
jgi:hypothetical protein